MEQTVVTREPEAITKNDDSQDPAGESTSQHARCVTHRGVNKDSQRWDGKTMVKVDDEFMMNWLHAPTRRQKDPSSQGPHNDSACSKQHVGVVCLVPADAAPGSAKKRQGRLHWFRRPVNQTVRNWSGSAR